MAFTFPGSCFSFSVLLDWVGLVYSGRWGFSSLSFPGNLYVSAMGRQVSGPFPGMTSLVGRRYVKTGDHHHAELQWPRG